MVPLAFFNQYGMREYKEVFLQLLRNIATSETFGEYTMAVNKLKEHEVWSLPRASAFRDWLNKTWLQLSQVSYLTACQLKELVQAIRIIFCFDQ